MPVPGPSQSAGIPANDRLSLVRSPNRPGRVVSAAPLGLTVRTRPRSSGALVLLALLAGLLTSCAPPAANARASGTAAAAASPAAGGNVGYLEGQASIGPLTPVERVGVPTPTPSPAVCTARGLAIFSANSTTPVTSFNLRPDCTFRVALAPGDYIVRLKSGGFGFSKDLPRTVTIQRGQTTRLDVHIDTGIR